MNLHKALTVASAMVVSLAFNADARTLPVSSVDRGADGWVRSAQLAFSAGASGYLYLAHGQTDGGSVAASWDHLTKIAAIHPLLTSYVYTFPQDKERNAAQ